MNNYCIGIDLHSDNLVMAMVDQTGKRRLRQKESCNLEEILPAVQRHRKGLQLVVVESTYNW